MTIILDALWSLALLAVGYVAVYCYMNELPIRAVKFSDLALTRNRLCYWLVGIVSCVAVSYCLVTLYEVDLLTRLKLLSLVLVILPAAAVDLRWQKIPNKFLVVGFAIRIAFGIVEFALSVTQAWNAWKSALIGALVIGLFFLLLRLVFQNSIGMGDVKLFALMGLFQGLWGVMNAVFFSLVVSFFVAVILLITKKKGRKDTISFGPSIYLGTVIGICMAGM